MGVHCCEGVDLVEFIAGFLILVLAAGIVLVFGFALCWVLNKVQNRALCALLTIIFYILFLPSMLFVIHYLTANEQEARLAPFSLTLRVKTRFMLFLDLLYVIFYVWLFDKLGFQLPNIPAWLLYVLFAAVIVAGIIVLIVRSVHRSRLISGKTKPKPKKAKTAPVDTEDTPLISPTAISQVVTLTPSPTIHDTNEPSSDALARAFELVVKREYDRFRLSLPDISKVGRTSFDAQLPDLTGQYGGLVLSGITKMLDPQSDNLISLWTSAAHDPAQIKTALKHLGDPDNVDFFEKGYAVLYYVYLGEPCPQDEAEKRLLRFNLYKNAAISKALGEY